MGVLGLGRAPGDSQPQAVGAGSGQGRPGLTKQMEGQAPGTAHRPTDILENNRSQLELIIRKTQRYLRTSPGARTRIHRREVESRCEHLALRRTAAILVLSRIEVAARDIGLIWRFCSLKVEMFHYACGDHAD